MTGLARTFVISALRVSASAERPLPYTPSTASAHDPTRPPAGPVVAGPVVAGPAVDDPVPAPRTETAGPSSEGASPPETAQPAPAPPIESPRQDTSNPGIR